MFDVKWLIECKDNHWDASTIDQITTGARNLLYDAVTDCDCNILFHIHSLHPPPPECVSL